MKKRYLSLLIGINLLIVSSISMSLAWFLGSMVLNVDNILIEIDADADIRISLEDNFDNAKNSLTVEDFGGIENFIPVSSMLVHHDSEWVTDKSIKKPTLLGQYKRGSKKDPTQSIALKGFFQKKVYLFSDKHMMVTLDSDHTYIKADKELNEEMSWKKARDKALRIYKQVGDEEIGDRIVSESVRQGIYERVLDDLTNQYQPECEEALNKIEDSVRFSIFDHENLAKSYKILDEEGELVEEVGDYLIVNPKKYDADTNTWKDPVVFGGRLSTSITRDYFDYYTVTNTSDNTVEYKETIFGDILHSDHDILYIKAEEEDIPPREGEPSSCFNASTRRGVMRPDLEDLKDNVTFANELSLAPHEADITKHREDESYGYLIELWPKEAHELTITVYVEGWDPANLDGTQEAAFEMGIHFRLFRQGDFY